MYLWAALGNLVPEAFWALPAPPCDCAHNLLGWRVDTGQHVFAGNVHQVVNATLALVVFAVLVGAGCSSKKSNELGAQNGAGLSDESLGSGGGSLALAQAGRGGAEDTGPLHDVHFAYDSFELDEP